MKIKTYIPFLENSDIASLSHYLHKKKKISHLDLIFRTPVNVSLFKVGIRIKLSKKQKKN